MREGVKVIGGGIQRVVRVLPVGVGKITGFVDKVAHKTFKKIGGITNVVKWPWKNKKHIGIGAAGAAGVGSLTYGMAAAGSVALGPLAIPLAAGIGGLWAYKRSKHGKKKSADSSLSQAA